ncbi:isocitrate lyase/phosphoenolpyruvate mutase family protein [Chryseobacterium sp. RP-3-3]|uniref:Isocitrate lyase/phosphoenolpyruvate mutase family protein n=1 Tax=Chryseobacterium antibioticum TaxID=2728847 RepID=A0A7Y0AQ69_9FLAO|nr:isocitrate lyase/phosphoenolpyruvate mutase family protein [Chryseobacterium antibioticum]NML71451.1 isocitrate lyase/phosphoenolpyruvate mutase family protein [Chryseobacterium antibioticum]
MTNIQIFKDLHKKNEPLLLGNVWNPQSAKVYEKLGYRALATSSSAVAHSLGYEDGENMTFDEYFYMIERTLKSVSIPLTVDLEGGYGSTSDKIVSNISRLAAIGVIGVNIEDSSILDGTRKIIDREDFFEKLNAVVSKLKKDKIEVFINVRTDTFLLGLENPVDETLQRIKLFEEAGADGVFVPCITSENDIEIIVKSTVLPVNVMCMPELPDFKTLKNLGVKRISSGNFLNGYTYKNLEEKGHEILKEQSFSPIFI